MPSSVSEEETKIKIDCLQPRGVRCHRLVFRGTDHTCLFSRGLSLHVVPLGMQVVFI